MQLSRTFCALSSYLAQRARVNVKPVTDLCNNCIFLRRFSPSIATRSPVKGSKVYVTRHVPSGGIKLLKEAGCEITQWEHDDAVPRDELLKRVVGVDAIFCLLSDRIDKEVLDIAGPQLKVVSTFSVGYDHIDIEECHRRKILIGYTPGSLSSAVSEMAIALLLVAARNIEKGAKAVRNGEWGTWKPMWLCGPDVNASTVGIVGMGEIGQTIAQMLQSFGVSRFIYTSARGKRKTKVPAEHVDFPTLLRESDFIILACSLNPTTHGMFNAAAFAQMKKTAILVNVSRGRIIVQNDLAEALRNKVIYAAALDVTTPEPLPLDSPLLQQENCTILPHIGSATINTRRMMSEVTAKNIIAALEMKTMPSQLKP